MIFKLWLKLSYYRIWIRVVFWFGRMGPLGPGTQSAEPVAKTHPEPGCCMPAIPSYNVIMCDEHLNSGWCLQVTMRHTRRLTSSSVMSWPSCKL